MEKGYSEKFIFPGRIIMAYHHAAGNIAKKFFCHLKEKKIFGIRCPSCKRVYVPPRFLCKHCFEKMEEWVELSGEGTLVSYTIVFYKKPIHPLPSPFIYGIIHLDGADTSLLHLISEVDLKDLKTGLRVVPVFREEMKGNILDIKYFRPKDIR